MKVGLFIPCYVDAFFPEVGVATLELLERFGCSIEFPLNQTCCGQPMANSGCQEDSAATEALFVDCFKEFDTIVGPSGSCVHHVRFHLDAIEQTPQGLHKGSCDRTQEADSVCRTISVFSIGRGNFLIKLTAQPLSSTLCRPKTSGSPIQGNWKGSWNQNQKRMRGISVERAAVMKAFFRSESSSVRSCRSFPCVAPKCRYN
jgi:Cysteine-rich domain